MSARSRLQMDAFWRMAKFLLEGAVFLLVGLQLRQIVEQLDTPWRTAVATTAAVLAAVVLTRFVWIYPSTYLVRLVPAGGAPGPSPPRRGPPPGGRGGTGGRGSPPP